VCVCVCLEVASVEENKASLVKFSVKL